MTLPVYRTANRRPSSVGTILVTLPPVHAPKQSTSPVDMSTIMILLLFGDTANITFDVVRSQTI
ncbi:unnamed protein product [Haemonchus placei]|uniref:Uncharacterized protein n=1 Tax=Haemonchus placei TaxID=6290 RepID=A0A0N4VYU2_HAEPC|nr:unnamed protein product [Haemonchus placei]